MRNLSKKGILPAAAIVASLFCHCGAQVYCPTNLLSVGQTVNIVGRLKKGMRQEEVNQFMATNNLFSGLGVGDNFAWSEIFYLTDNCSLYLDYGGNDWGSHGVSSLAAAHIQSNQVDIISIPLTNAPASNGKISKDTSAGTPLK